MSDIWHIQSYRIKCWYRYDFAQVKKKSSGLSSSGPNIQVLVSVSLYVDKKKNLCWWWCWFNNYQTQKTSLSSQPSRLHLDVLVIPEISKNLFSVSQLTKDDSCVFEFLKADLKIKEHKRWRIIVTGNRKGDLHALNLKKIAFFAVKSGKATDELWYTCLGNHHSNILRVLSICTFY